MVKFYINDLLYECFKSHIEYLGAYCNLHISGHSVTVFKHTIKKHNNHLKMINIAFQITLKANCNALGSPIIIQCPRTSTIWIRWIIDFYCDLRWLCLFFY